MRTKLSLCFVVVLTLGLAAAGSAFTPRVVGTSIADQLDLDLFLATIAEGENCGLDLDPATGISQRLEPVPVVCGLDCAYEFAACSDACHPDDITQECFQTCAQEFHACRAGC